MVLRLDTRFKSLIDNNMIMVESLRLEEVPLTGLDQIERQLEGRQTGDEVEAVDGYTETELLNYGVEKERFSRENILSDYDDFEFEDKAIQAISTAGAGALATMLGGEWQSAYLLGLAAYTGTEFALREGIQRSEDPARDEDLEEAFQQYTNDL